MYVSGAIEQMDAYELITRGDELPVFAFKVLDDVDTFTTTPASPRW